jgi:hypothetical protein
MLRVKGTANRIAGPTWCGSEGDRGYTRDGRGDVTRTETLTRPMWPRCRNYRVDQNHRGRRGSWPSHDAYGVALPLATGSKAHIAGLPEIAAKRDMTVVERGLCRGGKIVAAASEDL